MSSFLSTPVYHAHQQAKAKGLEFLSRSELFEITAALLGYEHYRLMTPMLSGLEAALNQPDAAVIFNESFATRRAVRLLAENRFPISAVPRYETAQSYVKLLVENLVPLAPGRSFIYEADFWADHLDPYVARHFLSELEMNPVVREAHHKVRAQCQIVEEVDVDDLSIIWHSRETWDVSVAVAIYARREDGKPDITGEYLLAHSVASYQKLDRAVVSIYPQFSPATASANRYDAGMGGERIW